METDRTSLRSTLRLGDNALVLGQRLAEYVTRAPELEEELANANFALDYIGQARMFYSRAGELEGAGRDEDDFAFVRDQHEFENFLLLEQPNGHFGDMMARQFLFESFYVLQLEALTACGDPWLAEIAARAIKEIRYHLRHVTQWVIRLGDGTPESHARMQQSLDDLWRFTGEMFEPDATDEAFERTLGGPDLDSIRVAWTQHVATTLARATLSMPGEQWMHKGGKSGRHTEHLGYLVAEMQFLQRAYPGAQW